MSLIKKLWALFDRRERVQVLMLFASTLVGAALEVLGVGLVLPLISFIGNPAAIEDYPRLLEVFAIFNIGSSRGILIALCLIVLLLFVLKNIYLSVVMLFQFRVIYNKQASLSTHLLSAYLRSPWTFHLQRNTAELLRNINSEVALLFGNVLNPLTILVAESLVTVAIMILLIVVEPLAASAAVVYLGGASLLFHRWMQKQSDKLGNAQQSYRLGMLQWINQALGGIKETKVLGREEFFVQAYSTNVLGYVRCHRFLWIVGLLPRLFLETLVVSGLLLVSALLLLRHQQASELMPVLTLFGAAAFRLMPSVNRVLASFANIRYHRSSVDVVHSDLMTFGREGNTQSPSAPIIVGKLPFVRAIELRGVSFCYDNAHQNALSDINMTIPKGRSVALTGPSGAGKTTVVDVILGLLKPRTGHVLVDGRDIHENVSAWQQQIGYVPQSIYLIDDSIRRNVAFGLPEEVISDEQAWAALRHAQLEEFVRKLPEGLNTKVGDRGVRLSGGQRQRIGIARALYHDPDVLVLDEATSSLDTDTEREFTAAIERLTGAKTLIIIAHRLSTVERCDIGYRINAGKLDQHYATSSYLSSKTYKRRISESVEDS